MSLITFSFAFNPETQEVAHSGVDPQSALQIVQQIVIAEAVAAAQAKPEDKSKRVKKNGK